MIVGSTFKDFLNRQIRYQLVVGEVQSGFFQGGNKPGSFEYHWYMTIVKRHDKQQHVDFGDVDFDGGLEDVRWSEALSK